MGDMASLWAFEELNNVEQLGHKLLLSSLELKRLKAEANEKSRKNKELIHLLKFAIIERDEAKNQLQKLLSTKAMSTFTTIAENNFSSTPHFQGNIPLVKLVKATSSVTESKSLSEAHNCHSHGSSSVDSLSVTAPFIQESNAVISENLELEVKFDRYSLVTNNLSRGKSLPQQGKFLLAVLESGPLLQTLILSAPLPRWRNPPQLQPFEFPTASIKGHGTEIFAQRPLANMGQLGSRSLNLQPYTQMSCGSSQVLSTPLLNFTNIASEINANNFVPSPKRQKFF
ncbi:uncharacterized protein [Henckelia pumila]|uniref:uncharacterized protein n=1 Tax=Henckelia pumila TaxID=405737 RepID=UPI003C6E0054